MTYDSPITCSTGNTSNVAIKGDIVDSYIDTCQNHYVLVKDSSDTNHSGMHKHVFYTTFKRLKPNIKFEDTYQ